MLYAYVHDEDSMPVTDNPCIGDRMFYLNPMVRITYKLVNLEIIGMAKSTLVVRSQVELQQYGKPI